MSKFLYIENYIIEEPLVNILYHIRDILNNGKLKDIIEKKDEIVCTCVNDEHSGGQEANPDLHINLSETNGVGVGICHCFACGVSCDFVKFVAMAFSESYSFAKSWLIKNYGILAYNKVEIGEPIKLNNVQKKKYLDDKFLDELQPWSPYLANRHLDRQICEKFKVKYAPSSRQVVFPVYDAQGHLLMAPRRNIDNKFFVLEKDIEKPLYGFNVIQKNNISAVVWCEGPFDCLSFWSHNIPAICSFGAPSDEQIEKVNKSCITKIYLGCDQDSAGRKFNNEINNKLDNRILTQELNYAVGCKDANEMSDTQWEQFIQKYNFKRY